MQPLATALVKRAEGKYLTGKESRLIENSRYGQRVANELDPGKIRSGEFSSKWTENINTEIINAEEYGRLVEAAQIKTATDTLADALQSLRTQDNVQAQAGSQTEINEPAVNTAPQTGTAESLEEASRKYGDGAKGFIAAYQQGQDIDKY